MKRLMIATLAAGFAACVYAAYHPINISDAALGFTGFESSDDIQYTAQADRWNNLDSGTVTAYGDKAKPKAFGDFSADDNFLHIDTESGVLERTFTSMAEWPMDHNTTNTVKMGEIYIDTAVKFTAFDGDAAPEVGVGAQFALWLKAKDAEGEDPGATNLMVKCATYNTDGSWGTTNVVLDVNVKPEEWHRLTIKTLVDTAKPWEGDGLGCFLVYIDGKLAQATTESYDNIVFKVGEAEEPVVLNEGLTYWQNRQLFPSMVNPAAPNSGTLTSISFQGSGDIDMFNITDEDPYNIPTESISLDQETLTLTVGQSATLTATVLPENATDKTVAWVSDDESVVTVEDGVVTAVGEGEATITATTVDDLKATCTVTVQAGSPTVIFLAAIENAKDDDTVTATGTISLTEPLNLNKSITINLAGNTLAYDGSGWAVRYGDTATGTAVISNGVITSTGFGVRVNQYTVELNGVTLTSAKRALQGTAASNIDVKNTAITVNGTADEVSILAQGGTFDMVSSTLRTAVKGLVLAGAAGTIDADSTITEDGKFAAVSVDGWNDTKATLTLDGTVDCNGVLTVETDSPFAIAGIGTDSIGADVTINEGAVVTAEASETAIYWPQAGTLTVNGGTITGGTAIWAKSGTVDIKGGTITGNGTQVALAESNNGVTATGDAVVLEKLSPTTGYPNNLSCTISGGTFVSANACAVNSYARSGETALAEFISGGTFTGPTAVDSALLIEGKKFVVAGTTQTVADCVYVAQVGDKKFETIDEAIAEGGDIKLLADVTVSDLSSVGAITVDANGNVMTITGTPTLNNNVTIVNNGAVKTEKGVKNEANPLTIAAGKTLDLSALSWSEGVVGSAGATIKLEAGATYKQGLGTIWDDSITNIFSTVEGYVITLEKTATVATIASVEVPTADPVVPGNDGTSVTNNVDGSVTVIQGNKPGEATIAITDTATTINVDATVNTLNISGTPGEGQIIVRSSNGTDITSVCKMTLDDGVLNVALDETKVTPTIVESTEGMISEGAVATAAVPGLKYTLQRWTKLGDDTTKMKAAEDTATGVTISLKDGIGDSPASAFYKIEVSK